MTDFVRGHDDAGKSARVFDDGHAVDFLEPFVHHARSAHVRESCVHVRARLKRVMLFGFPFCPKLYIIMVKCNYEYDERCAAVDISRDVSPGQIVFIVFMCIRQNSKISAISPQSL